MNTLVRLAHCGGTTDRITYQRNVGLLALGKSAADLLTLSFSADPAASDVAWAWLNPFSLVRPWLAGTMPLAICLSTLLFFSALVWNSVHRARHVGWPHWLGLATALPFMGVALTIALSLVPGRKRSVWDIV